MSEYLNLSDDDLYALTPNERRVVRLAAKGGWATGSPGQAAVDAVGRKTGLSCQGESSPGEARAYWPLTKTDKLGFQALAARLDALPRRSQRRNGAALETTVPPEDLGRLAANLEVEIHKAYSHWQALVDKRIRLQARLDDGSDGGLS